MPTTIRVGPVTYQVILDEAEIRAASDNADLPEGGEWIAFSDHAKLIIALNPAHAAEANRYSLVHELLHCVLRVSGAWPNSYARLLHEARDRDEGHPVEEFTIAAMSGPLLSTLRDNPDLVAYLTS